MQARIEAFAKEHDASFGTVRRYAANLDFAEQLLKDFPEVSRGQLSRMPLASIQALKRISRFGKDEVAGIVSKVVDRSLIGDALVRTEEAIRVRAGLVPRAVETNAHSIRLRYRLFRDRAMSACSKAVTARGGLFKEVQAAGALPPLSLDAISRTAKGDWEGYKLLPASVIAKDRERIKDAMLLGLAASRVMTAYMFLVQREEDAEALGKSIMQAGSCGIGIAKLGEDGSLAVAAPPARYTPPDLAKEWKGRLSALVAEDSDAGGLPLPSPSRRDRRPAYQGKPASKQNKP